MSTRIAILCLAAVVFSSTASFAEETTRKEEETVSYLLQGRWEIVAGVNQGNKLSESQVEGTFVRLTNNLIVTYDRDERETYRAVFRIDESQKPTHITMTTVPKNPPSNELKSEDQYPNAVASGILKLDGRTKWVLCYALPGEDRPEKFESPKGSKIMMFTMQRTQGDTVPAEAVEKIQTSRVVDQPDK